MHSIKQSMRRPARTLLGILLITLAAAVLCVCLGQSLAAGATDSLLDEKYLTVAFPSDLYSPEAHEWAVAYAAEHPEIIKEIRSSVLASAYIQGLKHENFTTRLHYTDEDGVRDISYAPFDRAVFEIEVKDIEKAGGVVGEIISVIALEDGYSDPTGFTVRFSSENVLTVGARYLISTANYVDLDYVLRNSLSQKKHIELFPAFDHEKIEMRRQGARIKYGHLFTMISDQDLEYYRHAEFECGPIAPMQVDGFAEAAILNSEWEKYISDLEISYNTFPTVGVDSLDDLAHFARGGAMITSGRAFSDAETADGEKVCIISEELALCNSIKIGDRIDVAYYPTPDGEQFNPANPAPAVYGGDEICEAISYEIVGIYRKGDPWAVTDYQNFTPNTIFVPKNSINAPYAEPVGGLFTLFVLENGTMEAFAHDVAEAGFDEYLFFDDNGWSDMQRGISEYGESANKIVPLGFAVWSVVIALFLLLYPARLGRELDTMDSLGATRVGRIGFVLASSSIILFAGSVLGFGAGLLLWDVVTAFLTASIGGGLSLGASLTDFLAISAAQFAITIIAVAILSVPLTHSRGLKRRK